MDTVAGRLEPAGAGEARKEEALLLRPTKAIPDGAGGYYIADRFRHRVRRLLSDGTVKTVLGVGLPGSAVDGARGEATAVHNPHDLALDVGGNLYVTSELDCTVVRLAPDGIVKLVAGNRTCGFSGDGEDATKASLNAPGAIAVDAAGRLYIADRLNNRIRRVDADGKIRTIAGDGEPITPAAFRREAPAASPLGWIHDIRVDGEGNVYFTEMLLGQLVRKVDAGTNRIQTVAALPGAIFLGPSPALSTTAVYGAGFLAFGANNLVYFTERQRIRSVRQVRTPRIEVRGGDKQSAPAGTDLTEPLAVRVLVDGDALSGAEVEFRVLSGEAVLKTAKVVTDADGVASTVLTAGQAEGPISVGAFVTGFPSATFAVTSTAPPEPVDPQ